MAEPVRRIGWAERWDGAIAGLFFGAIGAVIHLLFALFFGLVGWWDDTAATFGQFFVAQLIYSFVILVGVALIGAWWDLRKKRIGRIGLWLVGGLLVCGSMFSLLEAPIWRWEGKTWMWLLVGSPLFAWAIGSGTSRPKRPPT